MRLDIAQRIAVVDSHLRGRDMLRAIRVLSADTPRRPREEIFQCVVLASTPQKTAAG